jgi:hypothetical protein
VEALESFSLELSESGLGVHSTPSLNELAFLMLGLSGLANGWLLIRMSGLCLSSD